MIRFLAQSPYLTEFLGAKKFRRALSPLLEANVYAQLTDSDPWEFAVEAPYLLQRGLSHNDLRFLVRMQVLDHAHEVKGPHLTNRQFRREQGCSSITEETCFVLSRKNVRVVLAKVSNSANGHSAVNGQSADREASGVKPVWNADCRVLTYDGKIVKRFKCQAQNQVAILNAFQDENWPCRILDPLAPHPEQYAKRRLSDAIKCLNRKHEGRLIRFRGDGTGQGVVWELAF